jgi:putative restriction endonuclease
MPPSKHATNPVFGHLRGYPVGSHFSSRLALSRAGVHGPRIAGIAGSGRIGARSVVLAGGYEDTQDFGDVIIYTGHGGRDATTGKQIAHQTLTRGNLALALNHAHDLPVRVIRGARQNSPYAPEVGYRYDGLYRVADYWCEPGSSGFNIWRFRLCKRP